MIVKWSSIFQHSFDNISIYSQGIKSDKLHILSQIDALLTDPLVGPRVVDDTGC